MKYIKKVDVTQLVTNTGTIIDSMSSGDDQHANAPSISAVKNYVENYSTTEQKIGTWIDGKPIYRKTIVYPTSTVIGSDSGMTNIDISHNITNMEECIKVDSFVIYSGITNITFLPNQTWNNSTNNFGGTTVNGVNSERIRLRIINDTWDSKTFVFTLEYTKTTD